MAEEAIQTLPPGAAAAAVPKGDDKPKPTRWWQWFLLYPTLVISVFSAIPTYIEFVGSNLLGVPFGQYRIAVTENKLWEQNVACASAPFDGLRTKQAIEVDAVVCNSGNVLVRVNYPGASLTKYKWVPLDSVAASKTKEAMLGFIPAAYAQSRLPGDILLAQANFQVICQGWVGNGLIRRVILNRATNSCFAELVNTFSGAVVSSTPSACSC
jgi:hypothetical protein